MIIKNPEIPQIGDVWKHVSGNDVFVRISDEEGIAHFGPTLEKSFYSKHKHKRFGSFVYTFINIHSEIEILETKDRVLLSSLDENTIKTGY